MLEPHGADAVLLSHYVPHGPEPKLQRLARVLKDRAGRDRRFRAAARAMIQPTPRQPSLWALATRAAKAIRPAQLLEILPAGLFRGKTLLEFQNRSRVVFHAREYNIWTLLESSG